MIQQHKSDGVTVELRATRTADPVAELRKAIHRKDLRFLGVAGFGLMVPGVPSGGTTNPVVAIRGVRVIEGTSDFIQSDEQERLQPFADRYVRRYNHLLFEHLLRVNDPAVVQARRKIDEELFRLERRDPIRDAKKAVQEAPPLLLIELPDRLEAVPGVNHKALQAAEQADELGGVFGYLPWPFVFVREVMTPVQRHRLARQIPRYIAPYNRYVFGHHRPVLERSRVRVRDLLRRPPANGKP